MLLGLRHGACLFALPLLALLTTCVKQLPVLHADPALERNTVVKPSLIPGAGLGAFARIRIEKGQVIGEYAGVLYPKDKPPKDATYLVQLPKCAHFGGLRWGWVDGKGSSAHMTRVNFAPRTINGVETNLQNAIIAGVCRRPYIVYIATRDIEAGEEILAGYGESYEYEPFMNRKEVQKYFCDLANIDCDDGFWFEP